MIKEKRKMHKERRTSRMLKTDIKPQLEKEGPLYMWKYWKSVMIDYRTDYKERS